MLRVRQTVLLIALVLAGCSGRPVLQIVPEAARVGATEPVLSVSTRGGLGIQGGAERAGMLDFLSFDVSVPPQRTPGDFNTADEYRRLDPDTQFMASRASRLAGPDRFGAALRQALDARPASEREVMVFVHGYNTTFASALYRTAQIRHDFNVPGVAVNFSWPSAGQVLGYAYDHDSAMFARDGLEEMLRLIARETDAPIVVIAHSMGSVLLMESLRQIRISGQDRVLDRLSGVILMSPDIDIALFRTQAARIQPLPQPFVIFTSERDRALQISASITGLPARLGNLGQVEDVADFEVTLIDTSHFYGSSNDTLNHLTAVSSPAMVQILRQVAQVDSALSDDPSAQLGLLPGTALSVRNARRIVLRDP